MTPTALHFPPQRHVSPVRCQRPLSIELDPLSRIYDTAPASADAGGSETTPLRPFRPECLYVPCPVRPCAPSSPRALLLCLHSHHHPRLIGTTHSSSCRGNSSRTAGRGALDGRLGVGLSQVLDFALLAVLPIRALCVSGAPPTPDVCLAPYSPSTSQTSGPAGPGAQPGASYPPSGCGARRGRRQRGSGCSWCSRSC